jgi:hypothetical protein
MPPRTRRLYWPFIQHAKVPTKKGHPNKKKISIYCSPVFPFFVMEMGLASVLKKKQIGLVCSS